MCDLLQPALNANKLLAMAKDKLQVQAADFVLLQYNINYLTLSLEARLFTTI